MKKQAAEKGIADILRNRLEWYSPVLWIFVSCFSLGFLWVRGSHAEVVVPAETNLQGLDALRGRHPRLFLDESRLEEIRRRLSVDLSPEWSAVRAEADHILSLGRPKYQTQAQIWGREEGNRLSTLAFAWLISREKKNLEAATVWARAIGAQPVWGRDEKTGQPAETGLVYGHLLTGLAMFYDYAFAEMDGETRKIIRRSLRDHAANAAARLREGTWGSGHALQSNHTWVYSTGVMAAGIALLDEEPEAPAWIGQSLAILRASDAMLSPDGASQEGYGYYQYGVEYLLKLVQMAGTLGFSEAKSQFWEHTADYNFWMLIPRGAWSRDLLLVDFADADRHPWYGPGHLLRWLARHNRDAQSQGLADELARAGVEEPTSPWLALLWKDAGVPSRFPPTRSTLHHFTEMGIVGSRSDWSGQEAVLLFKSGNPIGNHAFRNHRDRIHHGEYFHTHRDANHFCLFGAGEWLIRNPGYGLRDTRFHNTLTVDGRGQFRDPGIPEPWPLTEASRFPRILSTKSTAQADRIVGDATAAYPPEVDLRSYQRELIFLKPDGLVVTDRVTVGSARNLEIRFFPESPPVRQKDGSYLCQGKKAALRIELLNPEQTGVTTEIWPVRSRNSRLASPLHVLTLGKNAAAWTNRVALSWAPVGTAPAPIRLKSREERTFFQIGDREVAGEDDRQDVAPVIKKKRKGNP
jgi:hypothetical protein